MVKGFGKERPYKNREKANKREIETTPILKKSNMDTSITTLVEVKSQQPHTKRPKMKKSQWLFDNVVKRSGEQIDIEYMWTIKTKPRRGDS